MKRVLFLLSLVLLPGSTAFGQDTATIHVTFFGSSVCHGAGAEEHHGYGWQFFQSGAIDTLQYSYHNASTGGDNTIKVEREDRITKKLKPTDPDIVVIGLSLANEGIMSPHDDRGREQILEQFRSRLLAMADSFSNMGLKPVIVNCYPQSYFNRSHYDCTLRMNRLINTWRYPSINVLGTVDDLNGRWVEGFVRDAGHPNTAGHQEMSYAIVPSLFEAIMAGKKTPEYDWHPSYYILENERHEELPLSMDMESTMHSFTMSFRFKSGGEGSIAGMVSEDQHKFIGVKGHTLQYQDLSIVYPKHLKTWTHVVLSHSYAMQETRFYVNGKLAGSVKEQLSPHKIHFGGTASGTELKDLMLHRSSLNGSEVLNLYDKKMIQSSLEFYNPLTEAVMGRDLQNHAQSNSVLEMNKHVELQHQPVKF